MLSYDAPAAHMNGQRPGSPRGLTAGIPAAISSKTQPNQPDVPTTSIEAHPINGSLGTKDHHIWLVTGPAGCGKTTVAEQLAKTLNIPYIEGDAFHPAANVEKMRNNIPLNDEDRWDWLTVLREESRNQLADGNDGVVVTCSALKRKYRDVIRVAGYFDHTLHIHFIFLCADQETLTARVANRSATTDHYMPSSMVQSQFDILEIPAKDEVDAMTIDVSKTMDEVNQDVLARVKKMLEEEESST